MTMKVQQSNLGFHNMFRRAKRFYKQSKNNDEDPNGNTNAVSKQLEQVLPEDEVPLAELNTRAVDESLNASYQKVPTDSIPQSPVVSKLRDLINKSRSKDVSEILTPESANPDVRNENLDRVRDSQNISERCKPEICKNYALSNTLNSDKLTEIINNSIKAAVQNLASDANPPCWKQNQKEDQKIPTPIESACYNATCPQRSKSSQNKENVTCCFTQYSQPAISTSGKSKLSSNICGICPNTGSSARNSKKSYNSHLRVSPRQTSACCSPPSKSRTASIVTCHRSVSTYKQTPCPCVKQQPEKTTKLQKSCKPCKPSKPSKSCKLLKTDNRKMTGNVNIYICSEGNDGTATKSKKKAESTCNSMTVTNASCVCSSTDVCASRSTSSSKTIRNLMGKRKNSEDVTLKCVCGKMPSECECDCECTETQSKPEQSEPGLCLCDMSSLNATLSNETCRDVASHNLQIANNSDSSPQGDYSAGSVRSGSSSRCEPCCTRRNVDAFGGSAGSEDESRGYVGRSKCVTGNSGRGDAVQECSCCETCSDYSDGKFNDCSYCDVAEVDSNPLPVRERYEPKNVVSCPRSAPKEPCSCCACDDESLYSSGRTSDVESTVCCRKKSPTKPRTRPQKNECCVKPCQDTPRSSPYSDSYEQQRPRYSNYCIMEEDEECSVLCNKSVPMKEQSVCRNISRQEDSSFYSRRDCVPCEGKTEANERRQSTNSDVVKERGEVGKDDGSSAVHTSPNRISVAEIVKTFSNADKSTSSNMIPSPIVLVSPLTSGSKDQAATQTLPSQEKEPKKSSLKWSLSRAKSLISGRSSSQSKRDKSKSQADASPVQPQKITSNSVSKSAEISREQTSKNGVSSLITDNGNTTRKNSSSATKTIATPSEPASSPLKSSVKGNSLLVIKGSGSLEVKSKELISPMSKLASSKLGSLIAERKKSLQSATNENMRSCITDKSIEPSFSGAGNSALCNCQCTKCTCCVEPEEDFKSTKTKERVEDVSCKCCNQTKRLCCCSERSIQRKKYRASSEEEVFRVCTLCCRSENDCCCTKSGQTTRRSTSPSTSFDRNRFSGPKSQICLYCEKPREKCTCRAPVKKCSYCGMAVDVCNCQEITDPTCNECSYDENSCQCKGRAIQNPEGGDQSICVTAWKPRRDVRKYFSRNPGERDRPDCSCCDNVQPYGSDELPYQRLSVFSDVMSELQQKISELPCCNRCEKSPCCCYLTTSKNYPSPENKGGAFNAKKRKSRSRSPPCRKCNCNETSPCKCGERKVSSYQICDRCKTTPCRCRRSRSTQRKPHAKCYYCKSSPCRCESTKMSAPKACRCSGSPPRSQGQVADSPTTGRSLERNCQSLRARSCRCRCGSPSCGSSPRGQEGRFVNTF